MNNKESSSVDNEEKSESESVILEEAQRAGLKSQSYEWRGPLPPQIINKMTPAAADEMVRSLCRRQEKEVEQVSHVIDLKNKQSIRELWYKIFLVISLIVFILMLSHLFLSFERADLVKDVLLVSVGIFGGAGIGFYSGFRAANQKKEAKWSPEIKFTNS